MLRHTVLTTALSLTLLLSACGGEKQPPETPAPTAAPVPTAAPTAAPTPTPEPEGWDGPLNPLTGLPLETGSPEDRPIAIMVNNIRQALPQLGVSQADIIYECPVEGGITRMLAVYQSVEGVGAIGSVRSSRPYYLELALGLDAIYLHAGGSPDAYSKIKQWGVTALDCVNGPYEGSLFWRDKWRMNNLGYEHSVITTGETITSHFPDYTFRQTHQEGYTCDLSFDPDRAPEGEAAAAVTVPFSNYKTGVFNYEADRDAYLVSEYGAPYVDGNTGEQVAVTNVLVLQTGCGVIPGDSYGRMWVELTGGEGWYAYGGKAEPITWTKSAPDGQIRYYTADGSPLTMAAGNSYVCVIPDENTVTFE